MPAIYSWFGTGGFGFTYLTSRPYPLYVQDSIEETDKEVINAYMVVAFMEPWTEAFSLRSISLEHVISYSAYNQGLDTWEESFELVSALLTQVINYSAYDQGLETWEESFTYVSGTLVTVINYIYIDQPPDTIDEEMTVLSVTLT